ncbi:hypothetical protein EVAR_81254_1 [Eumeta japonica]|uniref:Uncharacterized protein n=1 Tax=Eumeta variegata TaxID=151549 RepID=A0A4C1WRG0_EUMVA|nr:hypothetical protein EVAR_81254_1 [Eumeta japonica]
MYQAASIVRRQCRSQPGGVPSFLLSWDMKLCTTKQIMILSHTYRMAWTWPATILEKGKPQNGIRITGIFVMAEQITMRLSVEDRGVYWATLKILLIAIFLGFLLDNNPSQWDNLIKLKQKCNRNRDQEQKRNPD